ncbi:FAD-dependent oxidoreductase [Enterovirga rhinocerotis]|nr:FAD-dependent oxidoreductase [Enterovirga rhinocerotis]
MTNATPAATVVGAGICGSWAALLLAEAGLAVTLHERDDPDLKSSTSHWAGGMLAPDCESDGAEPVVVRLGKRSLDLWSSHLPDVPMEGSLIVAHPRDRSELDRFARQTSGHRRVDEDAIASLEPALAGRFRSGLFFPSEGHVEPRAVLPALHEKLRARGGTIRFGSEVDPAVLTGLVVDCRGIAARGDQPDLRGVKGETVLIETPEVTLTRPVRLMHPRWPIYLIPRPGHRYLIGASSIESEDASGVTVRSALDLLTAAYTLHPAFGEARIVELGTALRPAFPDNAPRIEVRGEHIAVNGLYRHGFLLAPALAEIVAGYVTTGARDNEVMRWS